MDPLLVLVLVVAVVAAGGGVGALVVSARRRRQRELTATAARSADATQELRAGQALVQTDDRVRSAQDELGFAAAQFGDGATGELARALDRARGRLAEAFRLRQALDDAIPDTAEQRREWTARILELCASADESLTEQLRALEQLRGRERRAPDELARIRARAAETRARIPTARITLDSLRAQYSPAAVAPVDMNPEQVERLLGVVDRSIELAERRVEAGRGAEAPETLHAAEDALERAGSLLAAVENLEVEALRAESTVAALRVELDEDLAEVRALLASETSAEARDAAERAIAAAEGAAASFPVAAESRDPLGALSALRRADADLDAVIAARSDRVERQAAAKARLVTALDDAERQLAVARDLVSGYRGPIGPEPRTRLAEAERLLDGITEEREPGAAVDRARRVAGLASEAASLAHRDLEDARNRASRSGGGGRGGAGGDIAGAVIGGLVVGSLLDGLGDIFD